MKMNKFLRLASALMILTLISTCAIGGTFAKYVTEASQTDTARVAKWGVKINYTADTAFNETYAKDSTTSFSDTVVAATNVVAPGTKGTLADVALTGTPEVAVQITYAAELTLTGWTTDGTTEYCPLVITVEGTVYKIDGTTITNIAGLKAAVEKAIADCSKEYAAGTNLETDTNVKKDAPSISWSWAFSGDDVKDTALGDRAAANEADAAKISLELTTTVTQIN